MSVFLDASVIVAVLGREPDGPDFAARLRSQSDILVSPLVLYEATMGLVRRNATPGKKPTAEAIAATLATVRAFVETLRADEVPIVTEVAEFAIKTAGRFGKTVGHPANLNMGDCFAYACAKSKGVPLLYKGDDFSKTDIAIA
ncbi:type II toxin-antitoxin system VapC family toxin [Chelatococcus sambhunathii]|uniref:Ribonuclease VapC n=1 Tax=Chelatococcus sambhunathii TaxID=363953 RepID=A0ABU1DGZ5_9HYPH|nr:type II toxin-antitoxin system VapC family toxin [Chelatococcus sambhunathii]MDR4307391.1 type II toxin-antitoxin system VapC family toxin [Chelatococcus sambhunathii]